MNNSLTKIIIFAAGALIGSAVTWKFVEKKYEKISQEEIDSVKETYGRIYSNRKKLDELQAEKKEEAEREAAQAMPEPKDLSVYREAIRKAGYGTDEPGDEYYEKKEEKNDMVKPYVIPPEEFNTIDGYETRFLTLYADGILDDDFGEALEEDEVKEMIGRENLEHMGEYEPDLIHIRNEEYEIDFEISRDEKCFSENE